MFSGVQKKKKKKKNIRKRSYIHLSLVDNIEVVSLITWNRSNESHEWMNRRKPQQSQYKMVLKLTLLDNRFSSNVVDRKHCIKNVTGGAENELITSEILWEWLLTKLIGAITSSHCRPSGQTAHSSPWLWPGQPCSCSLLGWPLVKKACLKS